MEPLMIIIEVISSRTSFIMGEFDWLNVNVNA
jgi:hypothetical protein